MLLAVACSAETAAPVVPVEPVDVPLQMMSVPAEVALTCAALVAALPEEIDPGVRRRPVTADVTRTAAWGEPAVTLECGVAQPDTLEQPAEINGVIWSVRNTSSGFRWTTSELTVAVVVDIPEAYVNGAELVNPLAAPLRSTIPVR